MWESVKAIGEMVVGFVAWVAWRALAYVAWLVWIFVICLIAMPILAPFIYLWESCLEWPSWLVLLLVALCFFGLYWFLVIAVVVAITAGLIQGFWIPVLVQVVGLMFWPLISLGMTALSDAFGRRSKRMPRLEGEVFDGEVI